MLTEQERANIEAFREDAGDRQTAYMVAADQTAARLRTVLTHLAERNFGLATDALNELLENGLPNDHGGPVTSYPLFEAQLELRQRLRAARAAAERDDAIMGRS